MVERTAAELAARNRSEADLARLQEVNATLRRKSADPAVTLDDLLAADLAFHHTVYDICGNYLVAALGRFVTTEASPWIRESLRRGGGERAARNHDLVIGMIEARNQNGAREAVSDRAVADGLKDFQLTLDTSTSGDGPAEDKASRTGRRSPRTRQRLPLT
jgi:DNA-binding GntR family transcriptional regulator